MGGDGGGVCGGAVGGGGGVKISFCHFPKSSIFADNSVGLCRIH